MPLLNSGSSVIHNVYVSVVLMRTNTDQLHLHPGTEQVLRVVRKKDVRSRSCQYQSSPGVLMQESA